MTGGRRGLTLIELMVAVAILAIAAAVVFPLFFAAPRPSVSADAETVLGRARELAVARAEPLMVTFSRDGDWTIASESRAAEALQSGVLPEAPAASYSLRITALGACLPQGPAHEGPVIDAVSCTVRP